MKTRAQNLPLELKDSMKSIDLNSFWNSGLRDDFPGYIQAMGELRLITGMRLNCWVVTGDRSWCCTWGERVYYEGAA